MLSYARMGVASLLLFGVGCMPRPKAPAAKVDDAGRAPRAAALTRERDLAREMASLMEERVRERTDELREAEDRLAGMTRELRLARDQDRLRSEQAASANQRRLAVEEALKQGRLRILALTDALAASEQARLELQSTADAAANLAADYAEQVRISGAALQDLVDRSPAAPEVLDENRRLRARDDAYTPGRTLTFSRRQFASMVQGMTAAQLVAYIGEPDGREGESPQSYIYRRELTYAIDGSRPDSGVSVVVDRGVMTRCIFAD